MSSARRRRTRIETTPRETLAARLRAAGCVFAEAEAALLVAESASDDDLERMVAARVAGEPLEYILGWADFGGLRIAVEPGVFVSRRRTLFLVEEALRLAAPGAIALDLCCGAGAIGAAMTAARPEVELYAADLDPAAVRCARRSIRPDRVFEGDLFDPLPAALHRRIDIVVANAPYVPSEEIRMMPTEARDHEVRSALDGGNDGLDLHRRIAAGVGDWLAPGGYLLIETSERQAATAVDILDRAGFAAIVTESDEFDATVVIGVLPTTVSASSR